MKEKISRSFLLWLCVTVCVFIAAACNSGGPAEDYVSDGVLLYSETDGGNAYQVVGLASGTEREVVIPAETGGKPVVRIGARAFYKAEINGVVIPDSVTEIGKEAFAYCYGLKNVVLPRRLTLLEDRVFIIVPILATLFCRTEFPK